ncbi:ABC transporter permease [Naasia lichenicola]|uniref:ABC transporter permease n=1 Tax=Naasia lichenicola TaxID=2565933 RepID=A0A4S4FSC9_9MICO|nr:ABC transporter permease [Naasia lichenicola]THG33304.1 ABC transporter permease [Naasia lichenicola]
MTTVLSPTASAGETAVDPVASITPATSRTTSKGRSTARWARPTAVFGIVLALWYLASYVILDEQKRFLLPPPHAVFTDAFFQPGVFSEITQALGRTALVALVGLTLAIVIGVAWAVAMSQARWIEEALFPYAVVLQCIPILALVPLIGFWFGFDFPARVIVCLMIALFPMVSNTLFGLLSTDKGQRELFRLQHASKLTILMKLQFPAALPAIFGGLRISAGLAVVGAVVGDFFFRRGAAGLGAIISNYQSRVQSAPLFAAIVAASLFGVAIFLLFGWIARRAIGRWYDFSAT